MFKQHLLCLHYYKKIECIIDKDRFPICKTVESGFRGSNDLNINAPSYERYNPKENTFFYKCTVINCVPYKLVSITQISGTASNLRQCYREKQNKYECEPVKYSHFNNDDKLLFLSNSIPSNKFYLADCLVYADGERVCNKKDDVDSHVKLIDIGTIARPNEGNILSQDELLCEETDDKKINCDFNRHVPNSSGLKQKLPVDMKEKILLKSGSYFVPLKLNCKNGWCGYSGEILVTRRGMTHREHYEPPGGSVYRCYYAKKQQVGKKIYGSLRQVYNDRDWLTL